jgi:hypothetical protein
MTGPLIEHIGVLVPSLEDAIERWERATGYTFSPIARYRTDRYDDSSNHELHHHDTRIAFSQEGPPRIELMEVTGTGTHGPAQLGIHHLGIPRIEDPDGRAASLSMAVDGRSIDADGNTLLAFTEPAALDGIRLEFISPLSGPVVADDGRELPRGADGRVDVWGAPL